MAGVFSFLSIVLFAFNFWKNRKELRATYSKLHAVQIIGVIISYLVTIAIAFVLIYYAGNWLVSFIPFAFLRSAAFFVTIAVVLFFCLDLLHKVLTRITKGIL
ncbi:MULTISPECIES: hypothetical protein [Oceanobacillus]|uniref:Uncharacterized protein n=1 Tax=Oceanobacillus aidingensis TaxID=645964 RepID=A0ABV9JZS3_9BACI|nr:hypothetical protein [Oceanobacillus oncorhynchi]MDM8098550.1 hypothetical protein [Oceanobacillus oncorhynchi]UUI39008.1 hypothetical protein NP440_16965 [Oceanobacillus oncorhynchi]